MERLTEYALLADLPYRDIRNALQNSPIIPPGWSPVEGLLTIADPTRLGHYGGPAPFNPSGFSADVFRNGNEIVISYGGTNPDWTSSDGVVDLGTSAALGTGGGLPFEQPEQLIQAAQLYIAVEQANPNAQITLTGHSLGGGVPADRELAIGGGADGVAAVPLNRLIRALLHIAHHGAIHPEIDQATVSGNIRAGDEARGVACEKQHD